MLSLRCLVSQRGFQVASRLNARLFTKKHEWVEVKGDIGTVGITDFATEQLGDVVYVDLPSVGSSVAKGDSVGAVESVKAASDIYSPVSGEVTESNEKLSDEPGLLNKSPFENGWIYKLKVKSVEELKELLDEKAYDAFKKEEEAAH